MNMEGLLMYVLTFEDVVEEIDGEIFDENDSKISYGREKANLGACRPGELRKVLCFPGSIGLVLSRIPNEQHDLDPSFVQFGRCDT
ncbi:hypothetical protein L1987_14812 [Smallanthus sonchifolius]|uniref:Uncharacterized protein n=1 Tax=Smallanthus sonchifolius TaxID=185202 RepID=A0ACB9J604_9ASTR|nr:hypothetical protein L1987_14812 [Smallanthus sonchifolius]